jgi:EAL domain-containing protein (putative c-di-GMP-specific phosphodiesterase class I)
MRAEPPAVNDESLKTADAQLAGWADPARRLDNALEKDEFVLFCQPILALGLPGGYPMGEVLIRLQAEEKSMLPPGDFLPVFEHYRMMPQLDRWVVRSALRFLGRAGRLSCLTVNLSGQTLQDENFPTFVAAELASCNVSPEALLFELDERDTLSNLEPAVRFANAYRRLGGAIMVDGFGRRSVSFAAVTKLKPRFVKVDGSITRKLLTSEVAKRKMGALLTISRALDFSLVAEFVESQDVLLRLKALGVAYAQGFGIHQPLPLNTFAGAGHRS